MPKDEAPVHKTGTAPALLSPEVAADALAFLTRACGGARIEACEVDAFLRVRTALQRLAMKAE